MANVKKTINVIGAGPAGLVAAINLAKAGFTVTLHESAPSVGHRFHGDFQGIENWTTGDGVQNFLGRIGVEINFRFEPYRGGIFLSPTLDRREIRTREPLFYLVERGGKEGSLDFGLLQQAEAAGVKVELNARSWTVDEEGVIAVGPRAADVIAKGVVFNTDAQDEAYAMVDDRIAPKGYAYLLINRGKATLATVIYQDFRNEKTYFQRALNSFQKIVPLDEKRARVRRVRKLLPPTQRVRWQEDLSRRISGLSRRFIRFRHALCNDFRLPRSSEYYSWVGLRRAVERDSSAIAASRRIQSHDLRVFG